MFKNLQMIFFTSSHFWILHLKLEKAQMSCGGSCVHWTIDGTFLHRLIEDLHDISIHGIDSRKSCKQRLKIETVYLNWSKILGKMLGFNWDSILRIISCFHCTFNLLKMESFKLCAVNRTYIHSCMYYIISSSTLQHIDICPLDVVAKCFVYMFHLRRFTNTSTIWQFVDNKSKGVNRRNSSKWEKCAISLLNVSWASKYLHVTNFLI